MLRESIRVPERGKSVLTSSQWNALSSDLNLLRLREQGVFKVHLSAFGGAEIEGLSYVGRVRSKHIELEIHEKEEGALRLLIGFAEGSAFKMLRMPGAATQPGSLMNIIAREYLKILANYLAAGHEKIYRRTARVGALAGGKLDLVATLLLRAKGATHLIASKRDVLTAATPFNEIMLGCLREIDLLHRLGFVTDADILSHARGFSVLLSEARSKEVVMGQNKLLVNRAAELLPSTFDATRRELLEFASVILSHQSFENVPSVSEASVPRSWFLNLETLFEKAVRKILQQASVSTPEVLVRKVRTFIFPSFRARFRANPDLVISKQQSVVAVGDVKYKAWIEGETPGTDDVYQLLTHARAFNARRAFLIYPGKLFNILRLGNASGGCAVDVYQVSVESFASDMALVAEDIELR